MKLPEQHVSRKVEEGECDDKSVLSSTIVLKLVNLARSCRDPPQFYFKTSTPSA